MKKLMMLILVLGLAGCNSIQQDVVDVLTNSIPSALVINSTNSVPEPVPVYDEPELHWIYGGVDGSRAVIDPGVVIKSCAMRGYLMTFECDSFLSLAPPGTDPNTEEAALFFCVFYLNDEGKWVGGKMDWIRPKNRTRPLGTHVYGEGGPTYKEGASWQWVRPPEHAKLACCLLSWDKKRRSNLAFCVGP